MPAIVARERPIPLRLTNPFNAKALEVKHTVKQLQVFARARGLKTSGRKSELEKRLILSKEEVKKELGRRGFKITGTEDGLRARLSAHNRSLLTPIGMYKEYLKKGADTEPEQKFTLFPELPPELRLMMWELSLPGPRLLTAYKHKINRGLCFDRTNNPENPASLFVNRESRAFARKRYRLVFGTSYLYANLRIDILHLDDSWWGLDSFEFRVLGSATHDNIYPSLGTAKKTRLIGDLKRVKRLALDGELWCEGNPGLTGVCFLKHDLRSHAKKLFPNLKKIYLLHHGETIHRPCENVPTPYYVNVQSIERFVPSQRSLNRFFAPENGESAESVEKTPKLNMLSVNNAHVSKIRGEDFVHTWGEPYYPNPTFEVVELDEDDVIEELDSENGDIMEGEAEKGEIGKGETEKGESEKGEIEKGEIEEGDTKREDTEKGNTKKEDTEKGNTNERGTEETQK